MAACGEDDPTIVYPNQGTGQAGESSTSNGGTAGATASAGTSGLSGSAGAGGSPAVGEVHVSGELTADTTWAAGTTVILHDLTYVVNGATLTIAPGTTIRGGGVGSALIETRRRDRCHRHDPQ